MRANGGRPTSPHRDPGPRDGRARRRRVREARPRWRRAHYCWSKRRDAGEVVISGGRAPRGPPSGKPRRAAPRYFVRQRPDQARLRRTPGTAARQSWRPKDHSSRSGQRREGGVDLGTRDLFLSTSADAPTGTNAGGRLPDRSSTRVPRRPEVVIRTTSTRAPTKPLHPASCRRPARTQPALGERGLRIFAVFQDADGRAELGALAAPPARAPRAIRTPWPRWIWPPSPRPGFRRHLPRPDRHRHH